MKSVFNAEIVNNLARRIEDLRPESQAVWGKMDVSQMLAHCNVSYQMAFEDNHPVAKGVKKWMMNWFIKPIVVSDKPYKKNSPTAPAFKIVDPKVFAEEKVKLLGYLQQTLALGEKEFEGKDSKSFGPLTAKEWDNMFYKHLDHHLKQFGV